MATAIEYGLVAALIVVVIMIGVHAVQDQKPAPKLVPHEVVHKTQ